MMDSSTCKRPLDSLDGEASTARPLQRRKLNNNRSTSTSTIANLGLVPDSIPPQPLQQKQHRQAKLYTGPDLITPLSDELLLRILSFLSLQQLLGISPVSRRFYTLACDSQLWKSLYYHRFVLPRARLIPGFGLHQSGNFVNDVFGWGRNHGLDRSWADETRRDLRQRATGSNIDRGEGRITVAGFSTDNSEAMSSGRSIDEDEEDADDDVERRGWREGGITPPDDQGNDDQSDGEKEDPLLYYAPEEDRLNRTINWKKQYRIRYNWAKGKCKAAELRLTGGPGVASTQEQDERDEDGSPRKSRRKKKLMQVVQGIAVTADRHSGLQAWDLRNRKLLAGVGFVGGEKDKLDGGTQCAAPSCMAIDDVRLAEGILDIGLGFTDGSFGVWKLSTKDGRLTRRYRHESSSNGELIEMAYSYPYLITATRTVLVSLYTFDTPTSGHTDKTATLPSPHLLISLDSHTCRAPLSFSIRKTTSSVIASIAYTVTTHIGWSFGVQDLHISPPSAGSPTSMPEIVTTPIAHTLPLLLFRRPVSWIENGYGRGHGSREPAELSVYEPPYTPPMTPRSRVMDPGRSSPHFSFDPRDCGPKALCYSHPYLVATLPDNTLSHFLCRSDRSSLTVTSGHRLWGHTSGISQGQVNSRGKAVSVSSRGEEMRVWALEGATSRESNVRSIEIRPGRVTSSDRPNGNSGYYDPVDIAEERDLVGFDDEMIVVRKQNRGGGESLVIYDFT
ncbi:hypothetical protein QBC40DRAFT_87792 [Triangularia verruculosa]|uniref:F-box domain-containing protein n=1 Tax=Triangularia verruculosa TaxID=2587418 RepID=A0AAN6XEA5_9PEZI|nr:hypothetical protein QBC40DRAFT_87792 [Triangularia verruculosa]